MKSKYEELREHINKGYKVPLSKILQLVEEKEITPRESYHLQMMLNRRK